MDRGARRLTYMAHTTDTFRIEARGQETTKDDTGHSEADAREAFHRMGGRGIGIKVINENTGEVLLQDDLPPATDGPSAPRLRRSLFVDRPDEVPAYSSGDEVFGAGPTSTGSPARPNVYAWLRHNGYEQAADEDHWTQPAGNLPDVVVSDGENGWAHVHVR